MNSKDKLIFLISLLVMIISCILLGFHKNNATFSHVYQVYLDGEKIGLVDNKTELLNLINEEQQDIKDAYNVSKVYPPNGFQILEYVTNDENVSSASNIYERIKEKSAFTIEGYQITITSPPNEDGESKVQNIYVLDDEVFKKAEYNFVITFVDENDYLNYINNSQEEIKTVGSIIKHMEFEETITIKKTYISTKNKIFTDANELTQYLLYGTTDSQENYVVKAGDTLASIAEASKLNVRELLIANPKYRSENAVLAIGDKMNNSLVSPILNLYEEVRVTEDVEQAYTKRTVVDNNLARGQRVVTQAGVTGIVRATQELRIINGERSQETNMVSSVTIREPVEEVTSVGPSYSFISGGTGGTISTGLDWAWPTKTPYVITTDYEYRWGSFHNAIDIYVGWGSPVYAANNGTVVAAVGGCVRGDTRCNGGRGNYIIVNHNIGGYYTEYMHLATSYVKPGQVVSRGQRIAAMGNTGYVVPTPPYGSSSYAGTHLHYGLWIGHPDRGGRAINPMSLY